MDETSDAPPGPVDDAVGTIPADPDPLGPYRSWASALFAILLLMAVVVSALVLSAVPSVGPVVLASAMASALAGIAVLTAVVVALGRAEPWAIHAIAPLCVVLTAQPLATTADDLALRLELDCPPASSCSWTAPGG